MDSSEEGSITESLEATKLKSEIEKLQLEIRGLKNKGNWADRAVRYIPLMSVLITVVGLCFGVYQFRIQQYENRVASERQAEREQKLRERELFKPLWEQQIQLYLEATDIVSTIATTTSEATKAKAVERFWQLYQGPLVIVESKGVSDAMFKFGNCLEGKETCSANELAQRSRSLATQVQESLSKSWEQGLGGFSDDKFKYH